MANSIAVANFYHRGRRETQKLHDLGNPDVGVSVPLVPDEPYFFRSTRNLARALSVSARDPKPSSEMKAEPMSASAFCNDSFTPNNAGYVTFSAAVSFPAVLPSCSDVWVTSST